MKYKEVKLFMQILYHAYSPMSRFFLASKTEKDGWKESVHFIADELNIPVEIRPIKVAYPALHRCSFVIALCSIIFHVSFLVIKREFGIRIA